MRPFKDLWRHRYGDVAPLGFAMRAAGVEHWLRFHALPNSKRYPETREEEQTIVERANILGRLVLGEDSKCWLVQVDDVQQLADQAWDYTGTQHYDEVDWPIAARRTSFRSGTFDALFLKIADNTAPPTLWMREDNGTVLAPYDGGFDLFLKSAEAVSFISSQHASWLSAHPFGL